MGVMVMGFLQQKVFKPPSRRHHFRQVLWRFALHLCNSSHSSAKNDHGKKNQGHQLDRFLGGMRQRGEQQSQRYGDKRGKSQDEPSDQKTGVHSMERSN